MVSPREKPPLIRRSLSAAMVITDEGTIRMSRGKARYKIPHRHAFCTSNNRVVKNHAFQFRDGLANYNAHNDLSWFRPPRGGNSTMFSNLILKMNMCYKGVSRELENFT
jgi:hypothetical protein